MQFTKVHAHLRTVGSLLEKLPKLTTNVTLTRTGQSPVFLCKLLAVEAIKVRGLLCPFAPHPRLAEDTLCRRLAR